jgi:hypothetical protein
MKLNLASLASIFEEYDGVSAEQQAQLDDLKARLAKVETLHDLVGGLDSRILSLESRVQKLVNDPASEDDTSSSCWGWVVKLLRLQAQDATSADRPGGT